MLIEFGEEQFDMALTGAIRESDFFPSIHAIWKRLSISKEQVLIVEADAAWDRLMKAFGRGLGSERPIKNIPDRVDYAIRACGGIKRLEDHDRDDEPFIRKEFREAYARCEVHERMECDKSIKELVYGFKSMPALEQKSKEAQEEKQ